MFDKQEEGKDLQLLIVDKKISFDGNTASFNNSYFCYTVLHKHRYNSIISRSNNSTLIIIFSFIKILSYCMTHQVKECLFEGMIYILKEILFCVDIA